MSTKPNRFDVRPDGDGVIIRNHGKLGRRLSLDQARELAAALLAVSVPTASSLSIETTTLVPPEAATIKKTTRRAAPGRGGR